PGRPGNYLIANSYRIKSAIGRSGLTKKRDPAESGVSWSLRQPRILGESSFGNIKRRESTNIERRESSNSERCANAGAGACPASSHTGVVLIEEPPDVYPPAAKSGQRDGYYDCCRIDRGLCCHPHRPSRREVVRELARA